MKTILLVSLFTILPLHCFSCPQVEGYYICDQSDIFKTESLEIRKSNDTFYIKDQVTVLDRDWHFTKKKRKYKHVLGEHNQNVYLGDYIVNVKEKVSCDKDTLHVLREKINPLTNKIVTFETRYTLRENYLYRSNLVETIECERR